MPKYTTLTGLNLSPDVVALNPQLAERPARQPKTDARRQLEREQRESFARQFETVWQRLGGPVLETEYHFCPGREYRADYRIDSVLIELQGGVWSRGRHTRGSGYIEDCLRANMAVWLGYRLIYIPTGYATDEYVAQIIEFVRR